MYIEIPERFLTGFMFAYLFAKEPLLNFSPLQAIVRFPCLGRNHRNFFRIIRCFTWKVSDRLGMEGEGKREMVIGKREGSGKGSEEEREWGETKRCRDRGR